jgi:iron complex outermembrane receptor protein
MFRMFNHHLIRGAAVAATALFLLPQKSHAQDAAPAAAAPSPSADSNSQLSKITVTGYIVPHVGDGPQPVTTLTQDYIDKSGTQSTSDLLMKLPSAVGNFSPTTTSGFGFSPGAASISLKGLPPNNTLVLVDGRRFPTAPFSQFSMTGIISFVDLNSIPTAAIDRIEILNDGGSATYGSDAIAGVVNIITKTDYNGADISNYFGISQRGDDEVYHGSLVAGISRQLSDTSKLSIVTAFDYYQSSPIRSEDRGYALLRHSDRSSNYPDQANFTPTAGSYTDAGGNTYVLRPGVKGGATANDFTVGPDALANADFKLDYQELLARETRYGGLVNVNYDVNTWLKLYDSFMIQQVDESSSYLNQGLYPGDVTIPANNPFNPFGTELTANGQSMKEFGPDLTDTTIRTLRNVVGLTIQLPKGWFIDASFLYGESDGTQVLPNFINRSRLQSALGGTLAGFEGQFFNPFTDSEVSGSPNAQFIKALKIPEIEDFRSDLITWNVHGGGTLFDLPSGPVTVGAGLEYRSEDLIGKYDENSRIFNVAGAQFSGQPTVGHRYVRSAFGEFNIPLLGEKWSWPGLRSLDVAVSERYDEYSDFGDAAKPKIAVSYKPIEDLTIRGTYAEGFVAPALAELFGTPIPAETTVIDPRTNAPVTVLSVTGGNPRLKPENAYSYYLGAVWKPGSSDPEHSWWGWANGFTAYANWYEVFQNNLIGNISAQQIVNTAGSFPGAVIRGPNGVITQVNASFLNVGSQRTDGIEFGFDYTTKEYSWGKLELALDGSYIYAVSQKQFIGSTAAGAPKFQIWLADDSNNSTNPVPDLKLVASIFYSKTLFGIDTFKTGITLNYVDSEDDMNSNFNGTKTDFTSDSATNPHYVHMIGSFTTLDWQISYNFGAPAVVTPETPGLSKDGKRVVGEKAISPRAEGNSGGIRQILANTTVKFGINNIGDVKPPFSSDWYQGYDTQNATPYGRYYFVQVEKKF